MGVAAGFRTVGRSGLVVSEVGVGASTFGRHGLASKTQESVNAIVDAALDVGVTLFDVADVYGRSAFNGAQLSPEEDTGYPGLSEEMLGVALRGRRDDVIIATKFGIPLGGANGRDHGVLGSRRYIKRAVESSLRRLRTEWIDLYQIHQPDPVTPVEETLAALDQLIREGKVRYIGNSNFAGWQIAQAEHVAKEIGANRFVSAQNEYSLLVRDAELEVLPAARHYGLGFLPYFPLKDGLLTGKYRPDSAPADAKVTRLKPHLLESAPWERLAALAEFAAERQLTPATVAFGWLLAQPPVSSVIAGVTRPQQIRQNAAATKWTPTEEDLAELGTIFAAKPVDPLA
ncbi:aldo/keto reductase [Saccharopolyspora sp. 5N102]|uniref:aldo/keto reductase n=1 Tax=Saccharopolyspora sp. 5N102 TaxID=3375155 RepID=UPI0037BD9C9E